MDTTPPPPAPDVPDRGPPDEIRLDVEAERRLDVLDQEARRIDVERARLLARIARVRHYLLRGTASMGEYGSQRGYRSCITRDLVGTGRLLESRPEFEADLLTGKVAFRAAAGLEEVLRLPGIEPEPWIDAVRRMSARDFCAHVDDASAAVAGGGPPIRLSLLLTPKGHTTFRDAKAVVEQERMRLLSDGEALEALAEEFMEHREPPGGGGPGDGRSPRGPAEGPEAGPSAPRKGPGGPPPGAPGQESSVGSTTGQVGTQGSGEAEGGGAAGVGAAAARSAGPRRRRPGGRSRYIPVAVRRAVRRRWGGRCAVPHCHGRGLLHFAHAWVPYRAGGPAEAWNLILLCPVHNQMMEDGLLRIGGTIDEPLFFDHEGRPYRLNPAMPGDGARGPPADGG